MERGKDHSMFPMNFRGKGFATTAVALFLAFFFVFPAAATKWPHEESDLSPDPQVTWGRLENGFRYVLMENSEPKDRVSMHLNVQAGSLNERENERGLAHLLEHMLFQGSENFPPGELVKYFQKIGMEFGPDANAHTGFDETVYDIILPTGDRNSIADGLRVIKDYAQGALLLDEQIESEKKIVLAEKRSGDSASRRTFEATFRFEFPESILSSRLPIGTEEVIRNADRQLIKGFYDAWYRPETMMLVMVGDFDAAMAAPMIRESFSDLSPRAPARAEPDLGRVRHFGIEPFYHFEEEAGEATVSVEVVEMIEEKPDSADLRRRQLRRDMAENIVQERLDAIVRSPGAPFASASMGSRIFFKRFFYAEISASGDGGQWEKSLSAIERELRKALRFGFTASEVERVKKKWLNRLKTNVEKAATRDTRRLANRIIDKVNSGRVFMSPAQKLEILAPVVESATAEQLHEALKDIWNKRHRLVLVTGNAPVADEIGAPEPYILARFNESRKTEVTALEEGPIATFPYLPAPETTGTETRRSTDEKLGIVQIDYDNGLRLNHKKTGFKAKEIVARLSFGSGEAAMPLDKPGLSSLAQAVVDESGVGPLDAEDLKRALAGKNTRVAFDIEEDRFLLEAVTVPEEIDLMLQLLYAHITDQAFRQDAYSLAMERYRLSHLENMRTVEGQYWLHGERFLAGGDPRFGLSDYDAYRQLTLEDVRSWVGQALETQPLELSVVGDFDPSALETAVARHLAGLPPRTAPAETEIERPLPSFPEGRSLTRTVDTEIQKALVIVAYPTQDFWNIGRTRRLSVLADVVSERLRVKIREDMGASYSPYARNISSKAYPGYGVFQQVVFAEPQQTEKLVDAMKRIVEDLNRDGMDEDELHRALEPTITSIREMRQKNRYWLASVLCDSRRHPVQLDWARTIIDDYQSIGIKDVLDVSKMFLDNEKAAEVVIVTALPAS